MRDAVEKACGMVLFGAVVEDDAGRGAMAQEGAGDVAPDGVAWRKVPGGAGLFGVCLGAGAGLY